MDKRGDNDQQADKFEEERERMVTRQIAGRGVRDPAVLAAMRVVPREVFVPEAYRLYAYDDSPLPIPADQTISQPYVVAYMIAALELEPQDRVLEIGTGSGYAAAILSRIVSEVYTIERHGRLADYARERLAEVGYTNVQVRHDDGTHGWPEHAPYDGIIVAAGGPSIPVSLQKQLAVGGRLIMPVGRRRHHQNLVLLTRVDEDIFTDEMLAPVAFVPLIGDEGW
jgi:protein-L-isoaspartate(D-aspartate) O-methyltransferase